MKSPFIDDPSWWKWFSIHATTLGAALSAAASAASLSMTTIPLFGVVPQWVAFGVLGGIFVAAFVGRLLKQEYLDK